MKPAAEWLNEVGEKAMFSALVGGNPPGIELEKVIKAIQSDARNELEKRLSDGKKLIETAAEVLGDNARLKGELSEAIRLMHRLIENDMKAIAELERMQIVTQLPEITLAFQAFLQKHEKGAV